MKIRIMEWYYVVDDAGEIVFSTNNLGWAEVCLEDYKDCGIYTPEEYLSKFDCDPIYRMLPMEKAPGAKVSR